MEQLMQLAASLNGRFPEGNEPFRMVARLAEECGEVAKEVNHLERTGVKVLKYGEPCKEKIAGEIKNVLSCAMQLAIYYEVLPELQASIERSIKALRSEGHSVDASTG